MLANIRLIFQYGSIMIHVGGVQYWSTLAVLINMKVILRANILINIKVIVQYKSILANIGGGEYCPMLPTLFNINSSSPHTNIDQYWWGPILINMFAQQILINIGGHCSTLPNHLSLFEMVQVVYGLHRAGLDPGGPHQEDRPTSATLVAPPLTG